MTLRIAATLSILLGVAILIVYLHLLDKGQWADAAQRHLRAMKDRTRAPDQPMPFTIADMARLPRRARLSEYAPIERRGVVVEGYVERMFRASDGDFHLDFAPTSPSPHGRLVPYLSAEITPQWHLESSTWRFESLLAAFRPDSGGVTPWDEGPRRVRLTGWLVYDFPYEGGRTRAGMPPHLSYWEIHPVTRIELWNDSVARFVEYPR